MRSRLHRPSGTRLRLVLVLAIALGLGAYGVGTVLAGPSTTVYACVLNNISQQNVRIVHAGTTCTANEHSVTWNDAGVTGPTGPTGPVGATGAAGSTGPSIVSSSIVVPFASTVHPAAFNGEKVAGFGGPACAAGTFAIDGWGTVLGLYVNEALFTIVSSGPDVSGPGFPTAWNIAWAVAGIPNADVTFTIYTVCSA